MNAKTVYVIGAGFSFEGGFPLQAQILERILKYDINILSGEKSDYFLRLNNLFLPQKKSLKEFLGKVFSSSKIPSLEDVFTLLDQTIARKAYCLGYSWEDLNKIRNSLKYAILIIFHDASVRIKEENSDFYREVASYLVSERVKASLKGDPFSILSLNWDTLLEDSIYWCLNKVSALKKIDIDYCCYTTPIGKSCPHTPSLIQKAKKIYNLKILKLHGSANWLWCPNCDRLYTGVGSKDSVWELYVLPRSCENCVKLSKTDKAEPVPVLEPFFITPTFTKVFDNTHIQMIWHNAYVELAEADKVVFIGYSLPEADYHLRTLIRRAVRPEAQIDIILKKTDIPSAGTFERLKRYYPATRYQEFFGMKRIKLYSTGMRGYFNNKIGTLQGNIRILKGRVSPGAKR